jgi:hypothetical protein
MPALAPDAGDEMDVMERVGSLLPRVHDAVDGRHDEVRGRQGSRAHIDPIEASDVDLTDCIPGRALRVEAHPIVPADDAGAPVLARRVSAGHRDGDADQQQQDDRSHRMHTCGVRSVSARPGAQ